MSSTARLALREPKNPSSASDKRLVPTRFAKALACGGWMLGCFLISFALLGHLHPAFALFSLLCGGVFLFASFCLADPASQRMERIQLALDKLDGEVSEERRLFDCLREVDNEDKVAQELAWCKNAFSSIMKKDDHYLKSEVEAERERRKDIVCLLSVLSFGLVDYDEEIMFPDNRIFENEKEFAEWKSEMSQMRRQAGDIELIWHRMIHPARMSYLTGVLGSWDEITNLGENLGVKAMVEAYVAGVPIEDITA